MKFTVFPAIDLRAGRVVRLRQGDPQRQTVYDQDPGIVASRWLSAGAKWLHVVNLDGAFGFASRENRQALEEILITSKNNDPICDVQLGGGFREPSQISQALELGFSRVILGTLAVENSQLVAEAIQKFGPERITVGIDTRDGQVLTHGWAHASSLRALDLAANLANFDLKTIIHTDVSRDGMGYGLNLSFSRELAEHSGLSVIASGGVDTLDDVISAKEAGLAGVIIGRALYEGRFSLEEALQC